MKTRLLHAFDEEYRESRKKSGLSSAEETSFPGIGAVEPRRALIISITLLLSLAGWLPAEYVKVAVAPQADDTGMVPGDVFFGNLAKFPGHAGIYLGKWASLPKPLQDKYATRFERDLKLNSGNPALKDSYLVIDSYTPRVMIRSFAEQFSHYYHKGNADVRGALRWESDDGGAAEYLPEDDMRRWRVVEEALQIVEAQVRFPNLPETITSEVLENYRQPAKEAGNLDKLYGSFPMDCITTVYVAYWRGAGIRLEGGWDDTLLELYRKYLAEKRLAELESLDMSLPAFKALLAQWSNKYRDVDLHPVFVETAVLGPWNGKVRVERDGERTDEPLTIYVTNLSPENVADPIKEFHVQTADSQALDLLPGTEVRTVANHDRASGRIKLIHSGADRRNEYEFDPARDRLRIDLSRIEGDKTVSMRGELERGAKPWNLDSDYEVKVRFPNVAHRHGPVQAQLHVTQKDHKGFTPFLFEEPYVIEVELGRHRQYVYPTNAKFSGAPLRYGQPFGFSRFTDVHIRMLQETALPEEMVVTARLPRGEVLRQTVPVPFQSAPEMSLAERMKKQVIDANRRLKEALALPPEQGNRIPNIARAAGDVLKATGDRSEASEIWRTAREAIRGAKHEESHLAGLQASQMEGAWLRGDTGLYRTLVTEREGGDKVTAREYLTLIEMLVVLDNDVEAARSYWPKFIAAVEKMPPAQKTRLRYDQAITQTLLLPERALRH